MTRKIKPGNSGADRPAARQPADETADAKPKKPRRRRSPSRQALAKKKGQIDIGALLSEPLHVLRAGRVVKMDPVEAAIRKQVAKALKDQSLPAIKEVIELAIKHELRRITAQRAYSPDLNPIEQAFSKLKTLVQKARARSFDAMT